MKAFKHFLLEKWIFDLKKRNDLYPIFENPGSTDLRDLKKAGLIGNVIRFIAVLRTKKIYIWAGMEFIHSEIAKQLIEKKLVLSSFSTQSLEDALCGECHFKEGRMTFSENDGMDSYFADIVEVVKDKTRFSKDKDYFYPLPYTTPIELLNDIDTVIKNYSWVGKFIDEYETKSSPALIKTYLKNYPHLQR